MSREKPLDNVEAHQKKQQLRQRLATVILAIARRHKHVTLHQALVDLSGKLGQSGPIDESRLPVKPDGFLLKQHTILRHHQIGKDTLCELQAVSMAVLYYWLYSAMADAQDAHSCERYCEWLEAYSKEYHYYNVFGDIRHGYYLADARLLDPKPPEWLDDGETV